MSIPVREQNNKSPEFSGRQAGKTDASIRGPVTPETVADEIQRALAYIKANPETPQYYSGNIGCGVEDTLWEPPVGFEVNKDTESPIVNPETPVDTKSRGG